MRPQYRCPLERQRYWDYLRFETVETLKSRFFRGPRYFPNCIHLGREDGLSPAKWIRQRQALRHIPVIAVTAHAMVTDHERVIQAGCDACISKPVDFKSLSKELKLWLGLATQNPSR